MSSTISGVGMALNRVGELAMVASSPSKWHVLTDTNKLGEEATACSIATTLAAGRDVSRVGDDQKMASSELNVSGGSTFSTDGTSMAVNSLTTEVVVESLSRYKDESDMVSNKPCIKRNSVNGGSSLSSLGLVPRKSTSDTNPVTGSPLTREGDRDKSVAKFASSGPDRDPSMLAEHTEPRKFTRMEVGTLCRTPGDSENSPLANWMDSEVGRELSRYGLTVNTVSSEYRV